MHNINRYIVIEGNIGVGKTTLAKKIAEIYHAKLLLEDSINNPYLPLFYKNRSKYTLQLEFSLLLERYLQLKDNLLHIDMFQPATVADYGYFKSLIFSKITLNNKEFSILRNVYDVLFKEFPQPDVIVILLLPVQTLQQNIFKRGRSYELSITREYLTQIHEAYVDYAKKNKKQKFLLVHIENEKYLSNTKKIEELSVRIVNQDIKDNRNKLIL